MFTTVIAKYGYNYHPVIPRTMVKIESFRPLPISNASILVQLAIQCVKIFYPCVIYYDIAPGKRLAYHLHVYTFMLRTDAQHCRLRIRIRAVQRAVRLCNRLSRFKIDVRLHHPSYPTCCAVYTIMCIHVLIFNDVPMKTFALSAVLVLVVCVSYSYSVQCTNNLTPTYIESGCPIRSQLNAIYSQIASNLTALIASAQICLTAPLGTIPTTAAKGDATGS